MSVMETLLELGGVANRATLVRLTSRAELDRAVRAGDVVRVARGRLALPQADEAVRAAHALCGVLSHTSAALHWGWELKSVPQQPHVTVPAKRKVAAARRAGVVLHRADLHPDDVRGLATSPELTVEQCLRTLPFDEGLAVADSALRNGMPPSTLRRISASARGPGAPGIRRACAEATPKAANPFESVLRAIALDVPGLRVEPQRFVAPGVRPDLVDEDLRVVIEADSFAWHGSRGALRSDARRYNLMVVGGWTVLRFSWEDVMFHPDHVRQVLVDVVVHAQGRGQVTCGRCRTA
jgi:very-short-patch-repair endonuclease